MLILIISGVLLLSGITMIIIGCKLNHVCYYNVKGRCYFDSELLEYWGVGVTALSTIILFTVGVVAIAIQSNKEKSYQSTLYEKQMLEYRLEHKEENIVGNEMLYSEIIEFNNDLRTHKFYSDNLWVGLFFNDKIATIEYLEID